MERIKQALELARQEREKTSGVRPGARGRQLTDTKDSIEDKDISYTVTRTVPMPINELREKRILTDQQNSISDSYKMLRTQVLQRLKENKWNTLAITSPNKSAGKSLTAINLAISLAREVDNTVLLVDANLRSPKIDKLFGIQVEHGLSDYLLQDKDLGEMLVHPDGISRFVVLPAGRSIANSSEMLSSPKMQRLVDEVKHRYPSRIVIFDLPPLLESSDALAFLPNADATLMVIEEGKTMDSQLRQAFELVHGNEVIGTVLNKAYTQDRDYDGLHVKQDWISRLISKLIKKKTKTKASVE